MAKKLSILLIPAIVACAALLAGGEVKTIRFKDGGSVSGEITKSEKGYIVKTKEGAVIEVPTERIAKIEDATGPEQEYNKRLAAIDKNDADAHVALAQWAESQNLLQIAREELKAALTINKNHERAALLLERVNARLGIKEAVDTAPAASAPTGTAATVVVGTAATTKAGTLSDEDIFRIRLAELTSDDRVNVKFRNKVLERFVESQRGQEPFTDTNAAKVFLAKPPLEQAQYILSKVGENDTAIRDDILVQDDPRFMQDFRRIWPYFENTCASVRCHGAANGQGGFKLINASAGNRNNDYMNFIYLSATVTDSKRVIDRGNPEDSLLLQHALPANLAKTPHPRKIDPIVPNASDERYKKVLSWISNLHKPYQPQYRLEWKPAANLKLDLRGGSKLPNYLFEGASQPAEGSN
jgi:hypothetical protein